MATTVRVINWNPGKITAEIEKKAMDRLEKAGDLVAARARTNFPLTEPPLLPGRKTKKPWQPMSRGELRKTIRTTRLKDDPKLNIRVYAGSRQKGGGGAFYAHMVEYGTVKMGARPFLRNALNASKSQILAIVENG